MVSHQPYLNLAAKKAEPIMLTLPFLKIASSYKPSHRGDLPA
jgi:hypothetical protein